MNHRPLIILIDLDSVLNQLWVPWYAAHNKTCKTCRKALEYNAVVEWDTSKFVNCGKEIYSFLKNQNIFESAPIMPGAYEGTRHIQNLGHEVYVVSSSNSAAEIVGKYNWLEWTFPHIPRTHIIMAQHKHLIYGDVIIDDRPANLMHPAPIRLLFDHPWNRVHSLNVPYERVKDWSEIVEFFSKHSNTMGSR